MSIRSENGVEQVSTHSRPKAAGMLDDKGEFVECVSTHSHPKAAGPTAGHRGRFASRFNSQPPEGGWLFLSSQHHPHK